MTLRSPIFPEDPIPLDHILIPELYTKIGHDFSHRIFAQILTEYDDAKVILEEITWGRLLNDSMFAANSLISYGIPRCNSSAHPITVAILATSSYQYYTYLVGAWLNGWTPLLLSTRNSVAAIHHLVSSVNAQCILMDDVTNKIEPDLKQLVPGLVVMRMEKLPVPDVQVLDLRDALPSRESSISFDDVAFYLHTSGSQGHPKPVSTTHRQFVRGIKVRAAKKYAGSCAYAPLPLFHGMGFYAFTNWPIGSGLIPTFVTQNRPLSAEDVVRQLPRFPGAIAFLSPSLLDEIVNTGDAKIASLASAQRVFYGGAPLKECTGNSLVSKGVPLANAYGMSEISLISILDLPSEDLLNDWYYIRFEENMYKLHLLPIDMSAVCELVIGPGEMRPAVINHELGFATHDLWAPHPKTKGLWKHMGRIDGVTVLSTGEKTDNAQLISLLTNDARIAHVVLFGSGQPLNGVIISPSHLAETTFTGESDTAEVFRGMIQDTVAKVNDIVPKHSRLIPQMILVEKSSKLFVKTDKGTVRSKETLALYETEIAAAYSSLGLGSQAQATLPAPVIASEVRIRNAVRDIIQKVCGREMGDKTDIFDAGADSLHVLQIRADLLPLIQSATTADFVVPQNIVYTHPTTDQIASFVLDCIRGTKSPSSNDITRQSRVKECIRRFSEFTPDGIVVVLTGSTGSLGCHVLDHLLRRDDVKRIHCLVRGEASIDRYKVAFGDKSLLVEGRLHNDRKLKLHTADFSKPDLGLSGQSLELLREEVTHIFHLAWELNFNWPLERFEKMHIAGVRHLIDLANSSIRPTPPKLVFSSSIGAVANYRTSRNVPEEPFSDPSVCGDNGYGEAKFVGERLIDSASRRLHLPATIIRCGQLSGSTVSGAWARMEFIPVLLRSSLSLGLFPDSMPPVRWLPVDIAARCFCDLALNNTNRITYYHLENTESTPWSEITRMFLAMTNGKVAAVPTKEWLAALKNISRLPDRSLVSAAPAAFLLDFYARLTAESETWRTLDTSVSSEIVPAVRHGKVTPDLMEKYGRWVINIE
ncbi:acetyl-CoA synthetase-like protein [Ramaria rubella]|nr:acetyl-CoA synthetase-like protein [Ramaria rubella]